VKAARRPRRQPKPVQNTLPPGVVRVLRLGRTLHVAIDLTMLEGPALFQLLVHGGK
jgi:hypothetical protein